jgi:gliding motility-associated protein GldL
MRIHSEQRVVIAGALFKIMHWPGANIMLIIGMSAEVIIFIISGFEPQAALHAEYEWERVYPELADQIQLRCKRTKTT